MDWGYTAYEWTHIALRWFHVFAGITWIGTTFYFAGLTQRLDRALQWQQDNTAGEDGRVWMVHGGGFFAVEALAVPQPMPRTLYWFKYEAALTWITGVALLVLVYYFGGTMVDPMVADIPVWQAAAIGAGTVVVAWFAYDFFWLSPLGKNPVAGAVVCFAASVGIAFGLSQVMAGRAAYIHMGVLFGTIMFLNVWVRILPGQKKMIAARLRGEEPDMTFGKEGKKRSHHNTYTVQPLIFIMLSNHFPISTYGSEHNWIVLGVLILVGWGVAWTIKQFH